MLPSLPDKAVRLFTFLAKAQELRQRPVRGVDQYTRDLLRLTFNPMSMVVHDERVDPRT